MKLTGPVINVIKSKGVRVSLSNPDYSSEPAFDRLRLTP
jgi:hypothetical protein